MTGEQAEMYWRVRLRLALSVIVNGDLNLHRIIVRGYEPYRRHGG